MEQVRKVFEQLIGTSETDWLLFKSHLREQNFPAKTTIIEAGKTARRIYFIKTGLLRTYHLSDGKEISTYFSCDNQFISTFSSFIQQNPSFEYLEAIEESTVFSLSYHSLQELYKTSPVFEKIGRILAEKNYLCILDRTLIMQTKTAKEKYLNFIEKNPSKIVQRVPQHQIASFLGIAPESLSRVRKEILIS